ncbi:transposase/IS protein [archaeon]|nr:transposase/IS protein [archaeon]
MNLAYERLHSNLEKLKLNTIATILDSYLEIAVKEDESVLEVLDHLMEEERKAKDALAMEYRMRFAGFPVRKTLEEFDFKFQPSIDKRVIHELRTLRFLYNAENVVFLGPPGVGKTHLAVGLGIEAIKAGHKVYFTNASTLVERLKIASRRDALEQKLRKLNSFKLIIMDEIGYLPFDTEGAHCIFQLISKRYEKGSVIFTSNRSYGEWGQVFQDQVIATAVLDRILHHCTTVNIKGESYRLKERKKYGLTGTKQMENV